MPDISKTQRLLDLIAFLVGRRLPVPVEEIMEEVPAYAGKWRTGDDTDRATARRTFERDKDELRSYGIPLETVSYSISYGAEQVEGYRIARRDFYLPYLKLVREAGEEGEEDGEAPDAGATERGPRRGPAGELEIVPDDAGTALEALGHVAELPASPLAHDARSAFRKLAFDLEPERFARAPVLFADRPLDEEVEAATETLFDALQDRKRVRFRYRGIYRDETTDRDVAPYGLLLQHGHWYLVGHDALRDDVRVFRVSRMEALEPETHRPNTSDYEIPGDFDLSAHVDREAWELGEAEDTVEADVLFRFPRTLWVERNELGEPVEERGEEGAVRRFRVRQTGPFLRWILSLEGDARILEPPELARELQVLAREVATLYGGGA